MHFVAILTFAFFSSCGVFLRVGDLTEKTSASFPLSEEDFDQAVAAVYSAQRRCYYNQIYSFTGLSNNMDDDHLAGGRTLFDDPQIRAQERFQTRNLNEYQDPWNNYYTAIFRANFVLESLEAHGETLTESAKNRIEGQARFLRAHLYYNLTRLFCEVPLKITTEPNNPERESIDNIYSHYKRSEKRD